jgi:predicted nucleic acid-binding protein
MMVVVDTSVWSLALRRSPKVLGGEQQVLTQELRELIREGRAQLLGPIRQELLSGIRDPGQFRRLRDHLRAFDDPVLTTADFEDAADAHNRCSATGIAGSAVDFLICAAAIRRGWQVFTTYRDFARYAERIPVRLHQPRSA